MFKCQLVLNYFLLAPQMLVLLGLGFEAISCNLQGAKSTVKTGCLADDRVTGSVDQHHILILQIPVSCQDRDHGWSRAEAQGERRVWERQFLLGRVCGADLQTCRSTCPQLPAGLTCSLYRRIWGWHRKGWPVPGKLPHSARNALYLFSIADITNY